MLGSTCIQTGTRPLRATGRMVKRMPTIRVTSTAWETERRAASRSLAPQARAMKDRKPTPRAETEEPTSQPTVLVAPTAAVAWVPREPTMAVSMYCTAVCISCSSMVGHARLRMTASIARFSFLKREVIMKKPRIQSHYLLL